MGDIQHTGRRPPINAQTRWPPEDLQVFRIRGEMRPNAPLYSRFEMIIKKAAWCNFSCT